MTFTCSCNFFTEYRIACTIVVKLMFMRIYLIKVRRKNVLKDFVSVAGPLRVSHFVMFSKSDVSVNLRIVRLPRGPTLTFKVKFCL